MVSTSNANDFFFAKDSIRSLNDFSVRIVLYSERSTLRELAVPSCIPSRKDTNSNSSNIFLSLALSTLPSFIKSELNSKSIAVSIQTSSRLIKAFSLSRSNFSLTFFFSTSSIRLYRASIDPNFRINSAAVFGPTPATPGIWSLESPIKPITSTTLFACTPNFSTTSLSMNFLFFMVSNI